MYSGKRLTLKPPRMAKIRLILYFLLYPYNIMDVIRANALANTPPMHKTTTRKYIKGKTKNDKYCG